MESVHPSLKNGTVTYQFDQVRIRRAQGRKSLDAHTGPIPPTLPNPLKFSKPARGAHSVAPGGRFGRTPRANDSLDRTLKRLLFELGSALADDATWSYRNEAVTQGGGLTERAVPCQSFLLCSPLGRMETSNWTIIHPVMSWRRWSG